MKQGYCANRRHPWAVISMGFMAVSLLARLVYYVPEQLTGFDWWVYIGIPGFATIWFPLALLLWGENGWLRLGRDLSRPVRLGAVLLPALALMQAMYLYAAH